MREVRRDQEPLPRTLSVNASPTPDGRLTVMLAGTEVAMDPLTLMDDLGAASEVVDQFVARHRCVDGRHYRDESARLEVVERTS